MEKNVIVDGTPENDNEAHIPIKRVANKMDSQKQITAMIMAVIGMHEGDSK